MGHPQPRRPAFAHVRRLWDDDPSVSFTDETTVDRRPTAGEAGSHREYATVVEAIVGADLGAAWIAALRRRAAAAPMKWAHVADFVTGGAGGEAAEVRAGLAAQALVVTDPMEVVRDLDLALADSGQRRPPFALLLFHRQRSRGRPDLVLPVADRLAGLTEMLRDLVLRSTLDNSGLGLLCDHMVDVDAREIDGDVRGASRRALREGSPVMASVLAGLGGSVNKAAKVASKATVLSAPLLDPDHVGRARLNRAAESEVGRRFGLPGFHEAALARVALDVVAERRVVVDRGHDDVTALTADLRDLAELHATEPFFEDRAGALDAFRTARRSAGLPAGRAPGTSGAPRGYVRAGDDREELRLQVADVAAGWARTLLAGPGYAELGRTFRCVLHNGQQLTPDRALTLDRDLARHRRLVADFAGV